jgi:hypothetical protein
VAGLISYNNLDGIIIGENVDNFLVNLWKKYKEIISKEEFLRK